MNDDPKSPSPALAPSPSALPWISRAAPTPSRTPTLHPMRHYAIVRLSDRPPSGYEHVRADNVASDSSLKILLPAKLAHALHDETLHALRETPAADTHATTTSGSAAAVSPAAPASPPATGAWIKPKRTDAHLVDTGPLHEISQRPPFPGWVRVWDPEALRETVDRHNNNVGSADTADRARDAAVLRSVLAAGPWRPCKLPDDVESCIAALREELPHMHEFVGVLSDQLRLASAGERPFSAPPMLLVGAAGVGKTHAVRRAAELLGLAFRGVDMSCAQTNSTLHGSERHWSNARPGILFELIATGQSANPMVLLDELDKVRSTSTGYNPLGPLHLALEPSTARSTRDQCICIEFDASHVLYVATANTLRTIPDPLLSRLHLIHCSPPDPRQSVQIARSIAQRVIHELGIADFQPISDRLVAQLAELTPRLLRRSLERAAARAVAAGRRQVVAGDLTPEGQVSTLH